MGKVLDEKCLGCGATLKYDTKSDKFKCEYCNSEFTIDDLKKNKEKINKEVDLNKEYDELKDVEGYHCNNCGASIVTLDNTSSTKCIYCKSNAIIKNRLTGVYKPDGILMFQKTKDDAIEAFKNICKGRPLLPKDFNNINNIQEMEGLYVPFWIYDLKNDCYLKSKCTKVTSWSDSNYVYTKTSYYNVERGGNLNFQNIPNDGATRFDDNIMNAIEPFNVKNLKEFETSYLAGYLAEKYDVISDKALENVKERVKNDSQNYLKSTMAGYSTTNIITSNNNIELTSFKYVLLPVWVLNLKYKDQIYHFAMNGESGKLVGEIPVDKKKLALVIILTFVLTFILAMLFFLIGGYKF